MIKRDYLMTMIEQMVKVLAELLFFKKAGKHEEALELINHAGRLFFGFDVEGLVWLDDEQFLNFLRGGTGTMDPGKCAVLSILLNERASILDEKGIDDLATACRMKALIARLELHRCGITENLPESIPAVEAIVEALEDYELPPQVRLGLFEYYESARAFARAEDELFGLLETEGESRELVQRGIEFYQRCLEQEDAWLVAGNLPREEVMEGLAAMKERERHLKDESNRQDAKNAEKRES